MNLPPGIAKPISGTNWIVYYHMNSINGLQISKNIIELSFTVPWFSACAQFGWFLYICGGTISRKIYKHMSQKLLYWVDL